MMHLLVFVGMGFLSCLTVHCIGKIWQSVTHIVDVN
jgi:hypothetical protein